jgi:hypothetical protein
MSKRSAFQNIDETVNKTGVTSFPRPKQARKHRQNLHPSTNVILGVLGNDGERNWLAAFIA